MLPRPQPPPAPDRRLYLGFAAAGRRWALPADAVESVGEVSRLTRLPTGDPARLGLVVHRGEILCLRSLGPSAAEPPRYLIALRRSERRIALAADELVGLQYGYDGRPPTDFELLDLDRVAAFDAAPAVAAGPTYAAAAEESA